jgi:hypothetical protein
MMGYDWTGLQVGKETPMAPETGYTDNVKEAAYELHRGDPHRPVGQIADALEGVTGVRVPQDTIRDWRHRYAWDARFQAELAAASPILLRAQVTLARVAGLDGTAYLRDVVNGKQPPDPLKIKAAHILVGEASAIVKVAVADEPPVILYPSDIGSLNVMDMPPEQLRQLPVDVFSAALNELTDDELREITARL